MLIVGARSEGRGIECDDVGEGARLELAAPLQPEQTRGDRRALRDSATEIEHALVLHIGRIFARVGGVVARVAARGVRTGDDPRTRQQSDDVGLGPVERGEPGLALAEYRDRWRAGIDA